MDFLRSCTVGTLGTLGNGASVTASQPTCASKVCFPFHMSTANGSEDLKDSNALFSKGASFKAGNKLKGSRTHFGTSAQLRDNAKPLGNNGASQSKISSENGALNLSDNAESEGDNGASQSKRSSVNDAVKPSESTAQTKNLEQSECNGPNSNRAGLFRTPISGGVQSATSSHNLPVPAVAVRNLIEQARFAHLCTVMSRMHHRRRGYPFGSFVDFAPDDSGHPIFAFSPLAIHTRNLLADPRCTLVVQIPGSTGLGNARVTIFGDVYPLSSDHQALAHKYFNEKHQHCASHQWGNFTYYRMQNISDIYFVGGFGTVAWVDVKEYEEAQPDVIAIRGAEIILKELNVKYSRPLRELLNAEVEVDDVALISIDSKGADIRVRQGAQFNVQRVSFDEAHAIETLEQAKKALQNVLDRAHACMVDVN